MNFPLSLRVLSLAAGIALAPVAAARADEPSQNALKLAAQVISDIGLKGSVDSEAPQLAREIYSQLSQLHPEMSASLREGLATIMPDFEKADADVLADIAHVLASKMNEQELKDTLAFFESPTGKKYLETQPALLQELAISGNAWRPKLANDMMSRLRDEMKKKGYEF
jgi:uncharacterized protein